MEDMLRGITGGLGGLGPNAASNPLLRALLGPAAQNMNEGELKEMLKEADSIWKHMDQLAENDPDAYGKFIQEQATAAQKEVEASRDPNVEGQAPVLVLEAQVVSDEGQNGAGGGAAAAAGGEGKGGKAGGRKEAQLLGAGEEQEEAEAEGLGGLLKVVGGAGKAKGGGVLAGGEQKTVAQIRVWAAKDAAGVPPPTVAGGAPLPPTASASLAGLVVPLAEYKPRRTRQGPITVHVLHVAAHGSAVRAVVGGTPPAFAAAFVEALSQFVEGEYGLGLSCTVRTLQVHRDALSADQRAAVLKRREAAAAQRVNAAAAESALPKGLLAEIQSLGLGPKAGAGPGAGERPDGAQGVGAAGAAKAGMGGARKPLIQELDAPE